MVAASSLERDATADSFFLRLPEPQSNIVITCPRLEDADEIPPIMNDECIYPWMGAGLPYPHTHEHALRWLKSVKKRCDLGQEDLMIASSGKIEPQFVRECPVRIIREAKDGRQMYLGDCGIKRWDFIDEPDDGQRATLRQENEEKATGDPTIIWTIGYYLAPSHHGRGIMRSTIHTLLAWATVSMNVRKMHTTALQGNEPSVKVLEENGFEVKKTLPGFALKKGERVGLHVLHWSAAAG